MNVSGSKPETGRSFRSGGGSDAASGRGGQVQFLLLVWNASSFFGIVGSLFL